MKEKNKKIPDNRIEPVIESLQLIKNQKLVSSSEFFYDDFEKIIERLKEKSFKLAVVGEFSSGKSTFLNALIGKDILKHGAEETTATITEIKNDLSKGDKTVFDVYYVNGSMEKDISLDKISEYTSTASKKYSVAEEIEKVVIKGKILDTEADVLFVDTPGLNGVADHHREKTIEQIKNAHACIYLMQVRGFGNSDIEFLKYICKYQHNIIFVQNFIDELKELEGETPEQKICEQKKIIDEKILKDQPEIKYDIAAISARKALLAKCDSFTTYNEQELTTELRNALYKESRFDDVITLIEKIMDDNEREKSKQKNTVEIALNIINQLEEFVTFQNQKEEADWEKSQEGIRYKSYEKLLGLLENGKESHERKIEKYIESEIYEIQKKYRKEIPIELSNIEKIFDNSLKEKGDEIEKYVEYTMPMEMHCALVSMELQRNDHLQKELHQLLCNAVLRIQEYIGYNLDQLCTDDINLKIEAPKEDYKEFQNEDEIKRLKDEIQRNKMVSQQYSSDKQEYEGEKLKIEKELLIKSRSKDQAERKKQEELRKLGSMPVQERKERIETYEEERGGFIGFFCGSKTRTRLVPYYDSSKQAEWQKNKSFIEEKYNKEIEFLNRSIRCLNLRRQDYSKKINDIIYDQNVKNERIRKQEQLLETKRERINVEKQNLKQQYLKKYRGNVLNSISSYLYPEVEDLISNNLEKALDENKKNIIKKTRDIFELSYQTRVEKIKNEINTSKGLQKSSDIEELLRAIKETKHSMEEYLCQ